MLHARFRQSAVSSLGYVNGTVGGKLVGTI